MTNQHPITPPTELVRQWQREANHNESMFLQVASQAAQWGADQELEMCCEWLDERAVLNGSTALRIARRPNSPSLKEQALAILDDCSDCLDGSHENTIRRALEALPND